MNKRIQITRLMVNLERDADYERLVQGKINPTQFLYNDIIRQAKQDALRLQAIREVEEKDG